MREPINTERLADSHGVSSDTSRPDNAGKRRQPCGEPNNYMFEGYEIHETFDPNGPTFPDCIVRVFA
jgi:hypothetical protein